MERNIFTEETTDDTRTNEENKKAYFYAIRILTRRDYSVYKIRKKLLDKGYDKIVANEVIDELIEKKYLREDYYAEARIKGFMHKGYSAQSIKRKLKEEYVEVESEFINKIFQEYQTDPQIQISKLIEKKTRTKSRETLVDFNFRKKLLRYLISKGHDLSLANREIEKKIRSIDEDTSEDQ